MESARTEHLPVPFLAEKRFRSHGKASQVTVHLPHLAAVFQVSGGVLPGVDLSRDDAGRWIQDDVEHGWRAD